MKTTRFIPPAPWTAAALIFLTSGRLWSGFSPGQVDWDFDPGVNAAVRAIAVQPDDRIIIGGDFTTVGGLTRNGIARLLPDGTVDGSFSSSANGNVYCVAVLPDGKILICGQFTAVNGVARNRIARLHPDGRVDAAFTADADNTARTVSVMGDGRLVTGGFFTFVAGGARPGAARLTAAGALDAGFNPGTFGEVYSTEMLPDGKLLVGGFLFYPGPAGQNLARLLPSGAVDPAFAPIANNIVRGMPLQADGKIVISGNFTAVNGQSRQRIARLHPNGTLDSSFNPGLNDTAHSTVLQANGKILTGGLFQFAGTRACNSIARLQPEGSNDEDFEAGANGPVFALALQADGSVLLGGQFTAVNGEPRSRLARLWNEEATQQLTVINTQRVEWLRGGSSPEASLVTFEHSPGEDGPWTSLGTAARMKDGWALSGLNLSPEGFVRARARMNCAYGGGSTCFMQTTQQYWPAAGIEAWRLAHFRSSISEGNAADAADPDHDGVENLAEYAFGLDPWLPDCDRLPAWERVPGGWSLSFVRPASVSSIAWIAEQSSSLHPADWTEIPAAGTPSAISFFVPGSGLSRRFLRLRVVALWQ